MRDGRVVRAGLSGAEYSGDETGIVMGHVIFVSPDDGFFCKNRQGRLLCRPCRYAYGLRGLGLHRIFLYLNVVCPSAKARMSLTVGLWQVQPPSATTVCPVT